MADWRGLDQGEKNVLGKMLEQDFPGRDAIFEQISDALVRTVDPEGSLEFKVGDHRPVESKFRTPVDAFYTDSDGIKVNITLHVVNGIVNELEIFKDDSSPILKRPAAEDLEIFIPT